MRSCMTACTRIAAASARNTGLGQLKVAEAMHYKSPVEVRLMRALKTALDPENLMNPGKVLPDVRAPGASRACSAQ